MSGDPRVALVTGTTSGIGTEVARGLVSTGLRVIVHGRDAARTEAVAADLRAAAGADRVEVELADLSSIAAVRAMGERIAARHERIDVIVNNAAVVPHAREVTADHLELAFATNVLAPYVLYATLRAALGRGAPARVVGYYGGGGNVLDPDDLQSERAFDGWNAYCQSKCAVAALMGALSRRHPASELAFFTVLPGLVDTPGMRALPGNMIWFGRVGRLLFRSPAKGARTPLWVASAPELAGQTGKAYGNVLGPGWKNPLPLPSPVLDEAVQDRVLAACERLASAAPAA